MTEDLFAPAPLAPPASAAEALDRLRLARAEGVGPATFRRLLARHGSAGAALEALPEVAARTGRPIRAPGPDIAEAEVEAGTALGARLLHLGAADYPGLLSEIDDPPPVLWRLGAGAALGRRAVAVVGARNASALGLKLAAEIARGLAEAGLTVVSGLARGVDAAAHVGALQRGTSVAAVAGGVDHVYPPENAALRERLVAEGAILSEMPIGFQPQAKHFPRRNRIVSGLALGVVVIEAAERSGSLTTVGYALEQGREAMAAPGHPYDARAAGSNRLIREGATLARSTADVLEALAPALAALDRPEPRPTPKRRQSRPAETIVAEVEPEADTLAARLHALLGPTPTPIDELVRRLDAPAAAVAAALVELELDGKVARGPGGGAARA